MDDIEGVTTPPTLGLVLTTMAETLRAAGYTVTEPAPPFSTEKPAKLRDNEGDTWYLTENGKYSLYPDRVGESITLEDLRDYFILTEVTE